MSSWILLRLVLYILWNFIRCVSLKQISDTLYISFVCLFLYLGMYTTLLYSFVRWSNWQPLVIVIVVYVWRYNILAHQSLHLDTAISQLSLTTVPSWCYYFSTNRHLQLLVSIIFKAVFTFSWDYQWRTFEKSYARTFDFSTPVLSAKNNWFFSDIGVYAKSHI